MLSILIPAIPERLDKLKTLIGVYEEYIKMYGLTGQVEVLAVVDNKQRSIGAKCNSLLAIADGYYVVRSDDDDRLTQAYFKNIAYACAQNVDVITYLQEARINEDRTTVRFGLWYPNQEFQKDGITLRPAWHCCTWKREFIDINGIWFDNLNYAEDEPFARLANERAKTSHHIPEVCHVYTHDSTQTASFDERSN